MEGQTVDFTAAESDAVPVRVDAVEAPDIDWSPAPPVRVIQTRTPQAVRQVENDVCVLDFGQNASGWVRLTDLGPAGTLTTIDYGEHLGVDGDLTTAHLDAERAGQPTVIFAQHDEVAAARRRRIRAAPHRPRLPIRAHHPPWRALDPAGVRMQIVHTDLRRTGARTVTLTSTGCTPSRIGASAVTPSTFPPTARHGSVWRGRVIPDHPHRGTRLYDVLGFGRKWLRSVRTTSSATVVSPTLPGWTAHQDHLDDQFAIMTGSAGWVSGGRPWSSSSPTATSRSSPRTGTRMVRWVEWALHSRTSVIMRERTRPLSRGVRAVPVGRHVPLG